jgi:hypothetical protein
VPYADSFVVVLFVNKNYVVINIIDRDSNAKLRLYIFVKLKQNRCKLSLAIYYVHLVVSRAVVYKGDLVAFTVAANRLDRPNYVNINIGK